MLKKMVEELDIEIKTKENYNTLDKEIYEKVYKEAYKKGYIMAVFEDVAEGDFSIDRGMEKLGISDENEFKKLGLTLGYEL